MAQNMYCSGHKVTNKKYRDGYEKINWNAGKENDKKIENTKNKQS